MFRLHVCGAWSSCCHTSPNHQSWKGCSVHARSTSGQGTCDNKNTCRRGTPWGMLLVVCSVKLKSPYVSLPTSRRVFFADRDSIGRNKLRYMQRRDSFAFILCRHTLRIIVSFDTKEQKSTRACFIFLVSSFESASQ